MPPLRHSPITTFLSGVSARLRLSLLRLIALLFVLCFSLVFLYFVSFVLFCFDFHLYFVFVGFPCICFSISLYCFSPSIAEPFSAPPPHRASNASFSVWDLLARDRCLFPCISFCFFACNKSYLNQPTFGCDAWSKSLGYGCEHYLSVRVEEDKC